MKVDKKELWRAIKYTLFAASAGIIQILSSFLLELVIFKKVIPDGSTLHFIFDLDKSSFIAESIGLALSVIWNFTFNRKFTFKAASNVPLSMALAFAFYVPFYPFQIWYINSVRASLLGSIGEDMAFVVAQITCILINFVLEFTWQRFVVFRNKLDTNMQNGEEGNKNAEEKDGAGSLAAEETSDEENITTNNALWEVSGSDLSVGEETSNTDNVQEGEANTTQPSGELSGAKRPRATGKKQK